MACHAGRGPWTAQATCVEFTTWSVLGRCGGNSTSTVRTGAEFDLTA